MQGASVAGAAVVAECSIFSREEEKWFFLFSKCSILPVCQDVRRQQRGIVQMNVGTSGFISSELEIVGVELPSSVHLTFIVETIV